MWDNYLNFATWAKAHMSFLTYLTFFNLDPHFACVLRDILSKIKFIPCDLQSLNVYPLR